MATTLMAPTTSAWKDAYREAALGATTEALVNQNMALVKRAVARVRSALPPAVESDDLIGYGLIGLVEAANRFDPTRGVPFEAYAATRVRGAILDGLRLMGWLPRGMYQRARRLLSALGELTEEHGRAPTEAELADHLNVTSDEYRDLLIEAAPLTLLPLDELVEEPLDDAEPIHRGWERAQLQAAVTTAIESLPERERLVVTLYFHEQMTLKEIAAVLRITEGRACQIKTQALLRMRGSLAAGGYDETNL